MMKLCQTADYILESSGAETELNIHDGTVRDLIFMEDKMSRSTVLVSGGAGNCRIHLTDCTTGQPLNSYQGHTGEF